MLIAQVAPLMGQIPPKKYGGTERIVSVLTEELVRRGHNVTLFASGDSVTSAKLVSVYPRALRDVRTRSLRGLDALTLLNIGLAYERQNEFEIIHDHNGHISLAAANLSKTSVVMTMHEPFYAEYRRIFRTLANPALVTISQAQALSLKNINHAGTVYNGLELEHLPFSETHDGYLLFVGRFAPEKWAHHAIGVARSLGMPLILAATVENQQYFSELIAPRLSNESIRWIGEVDEERRNLLYSRARAFLHPITWREPFGLTMIEAMACGCPVIAFNRGSVPEIVVEGKTGFVVNNVAEMVEAVKKTETISRADCRMHALTYFNAKRMTDGYEAIYQHLLLNR